MHDEPSLAIRVAWLGMWLVAILAVSVAAGRAAVPAASLLIGIFLALLVDGTRRK